MAESTTVIEIVARVKDETEPGGSKLLETVSKIENAMKKIEEQAERMKKMSKLELTAHFIDKASAGIQKVVNWGKSIAGKIWTVTVKAVDLVTAPLRGIWNAITSPIAGMAAFAGISLGVGDATKTFMDFEQQMSAVGATAGASQRELSQLTEQAKELGASTAFSALEAAEGMENLASAGFSTPEILAAMPGMLDLAAASGEGLAASAEYATNALRGFGLEASESGRVADVFAKAAADTNASVASMGEAMQYIAPGAHAAGISLENTAAAIGILSDAGIKGSSAGTGLQAILTSMTERSDAAALMIKKLGIQFYDAKGNAKDFTGIVESTAKALKGMNDKDRMAALDTIFGVQASKAMNVLITRSAEELAAMTKKMDAAEDSSKTMAGLRMDNLAGSIEELSGAFETLKIEAVERFAPGLRKGIDWLTAKMPEISGAVLRAADVISETIGFKIKEIKRNINSVLDSSEWANAKSPFEKITILWDKIIVEPFSAWWNGSGKAWLTEKAGEIGNGIGSGLTKGLLGLLGVETDGIVNEGLSVGQSFLDGFLKGFDGAKIFEAIKGALGNLFSDAAKILPGGGKASETSWLSAGISAMLLKGLGVDKMAGGAFIKLSALAGKAILAGGPEAMAPWMAAAGGGASVAGAALGVAGLVSAVADLREASKTHNANLDKQISAGVKVGAVAAGAAIGTAILPGIGTAVGAGVGGLVALTAGGAIGETIAGWIDGTGKMKESADALYKTRSAYEETRSKIEETTKAIEEYREATDKLSNWKAGLKGVSEDPIEETKKAQTNMIEQLQEKYKGLITQYDIENGKLEEKLALIERIMAAEEQQRIVELKTTVIQGEKDFSKIEQKVQESKEQQEKWSNKSGRLYDFQSKAITLETDFAKANADMELDIARNGNKYDEKKHEGVLNDLALRSNQLNADYEDTGFIFTPLDYETKYASTAVGNEITRLNNSIEKAEAETKKWITQYQELYNTKMTLLDIEQYEGKGLAKDLQKYNELAELKNRGPEMEEYKQWETSQSVRSLGANASIYAQQNAQNQAQNDKRFTGKAAEYERLNEQLEKYGGEDIAGRQEKINEQFEALGKKLEPVIGQVEGLNKEFGLLPSDKKINVEIAIKGIEELRELKGALASTEGKTVSKALSSAEDKTQTKLSSPATMLTRAVPYADGGIMTRPHMGLVAEDGAEAIIPLAGKRRERGLSLWEKAGEMLGVRAYADGGIIGKPEPQRVDFVPAKSKAGASSNVAACAGAVVAVSIDGVNFAVNISDGAKGGADEVLKVIRENVKNITDDIAYQLSVALQQSFANTPKAAGDVF